MPVMVYWMMRKTIEMAMPVAMTFSPVPIMRPSLPPALISQIIVNM